ncbi:MAG TPA: hypothetical protein VLN26_08710, partial [Gaiellaceae bacterium]|nr:hypothetical protein [Gaiellaceae bacterium]
MLRTIAAACGLAALVLAGTASAAPPALLTVGQSGGHAVASWSLPSGYQTWTVEVATSSALDTDGGFLSANVVDINVFMDGSTSWTGSVDLDPGTYYVHVSGACTTCGIPEWSGVRSFSVPVATPTPMPSPTPTPTPAPTPTPTPTPTPAPAPTPTPTPTPTSTPMPKPGKQAPNAAPRVAAVDLSRSGASARVTLRACDDAAGRLVVRVTARRGEATRT